jgi:hypothetical protein
MRALFSLSYLCLSSLSRLSLCRARSLTHDTPKYTHREVVQENLGEIQRVFADHGLRANVRLQVRCLIERERERERESEKGEREGREGGREGASDCE